MVFAVVAVHNAENKSADVIRNAVRFGFLDILMSSYIGFLVDFNISNCCWLGKKIWDLLACGLVRGLQGRCLGSLARFLHCAMLCIAPVEMTVGRGAVHRAEDK
jgi:hypothetical protein